MEEQGSPISLHEFMALVIGDIIYYRMKPTDNPIDENKEWKGIILSIVYSSEYIKVKLLTPGYEGEVEGVNRWQIVRYEKQHA